jgi:hypothetical protein
MTNKQAKILWEDLIERGTIKYAIKKLAMDREKANIFLMHSMPEMFVDKDINIINKKKLEKLKKRNAKISKIIKNKQSLDTTLSIGILVYLMIVTPIFILITYIIHF